MCDCVCVCVYVLASHRYFQQHLSHFSVCSRVGLPMRLCWLQNAGQETDVCCCAVLTVFCFPPPLLPPTPPPSPPPSSTLPLQGCQRVVEDWQKILMVRSLVINPHEDMRTWLKYASLCGKSGRLVSTHVAPATRCLVMTTCPGA